MTSGANSSRSSRVLLVEDEYLVAIDMAEALESHGFEVIGPAADVKSAAAFATNEQAIDAALLDVNLRGEFVWPVAEILQQRAVPTILTTGYNASEIPAAYAHLPRHQKPVIASRLIRHLHELLAALGR